MHIVYTRGVMILNKFSIAVGQCKNQRSVIIFVYINLLLSSIESFLPFSLFFAPLCVVNVSFSLRGLLICSSSLNVSSDSHLEIQ